MRGIELDQAYPDLFTPTEARFLASLQKPAVNVAPRERIVRANVPVSESVYLQAGFVGRYRSDRRGRRQFLALQIPGDFIDLPSYMLERLDHDIDAFTAVSVRPLPHSEIAALECEHPSIYNRLWRISMIDASIHRYWIFRVGRLMGRARVANFFSEIMVRLYSRNLCGTDGFELPISQIDLAEACGISAVHANRLLGELRAEGVCTFSHGEVQVGDFGELLRAGEFDWDYLFVPPRIDLFLSQLTGRPKVEKVQAAAARS